MKNFYQCKVCLETFSLLRYLRKHVTIPAVIDHQPNECQSYYSRTGNLQQNLKVNHKIVTEEPTEEFNCTTKGQGVHLLSTRNQEKTAYSKEDDCWNIEDEHGRLKFEPDEQDELYFFDQENPIFPYNDNAHKSPQKFVNTEDKTKEDNHETSFLKNKEQVEAPIKQALIERHNSPSREIVNNILGPNTTEVNSPTETTICKKCKLACPSLENLCVHYETIHKLPIVSLARVNTNPKCKRTEASNTEVTTNKQTKTHECGICSKKFTARHFLKNHESSVHEEKLFVCNVCQKTFHYLQTLKIHQLSVHEGFRYTCNICPKKFCYLSHLNRHKSSIHDNIRFTCDICQKEFSQLDNLKTHKLHVHEKIVYKCNNCSKQFTSSRGLSYHKANVHEGVRYECNLCEKQFRHGTTLRNHKASSHGGVRHKCDNCPSEYSYLKDLRRHKSVAHNTQ